MDLYRIDYENIYINQSFRMNEEQAVVLPRNLVQEKVNGVNGYCSDGAGRQLEKICKKIEFPSIVLEGTGNYHYITYFLLEQIQEDFTLVLFDFHSDMLLHGLGYQQLSCGNWLNKALMENDRLKQVVFVGLGDAYKPCVDHVKEKSLFIYTKDSMKRETWKEEISDLIKYPVYISIDKDVFDPSVAYTNWDQGTLQKGEAVSLIHQLKENHKLIAGDLCGEYPNYYTDINYDFYREKNRMVNEQLIHAIYM